MEKEHFLGLDIGTSGAKAVVIDRKGSLVSLSQQEYPIQTPFQGWAEQDPRVWLTASIQCIREAIQQANLDPSLIAGVGLAGQMHGLVCLDDQGIPVRSAIIWADQRSYAQVKRLVQEIGQEKLAEFTGNPLATGFMLASWAWLLDHERKTTSKTRWLLLPKDYVRYRMTGKIGSEPSDASSTLLFDPHRRCWASPILGLVELSEYRLPEIHPSSEIAGEITPEFSEITGLLPGTPVVYGSSDVSAQALAQKVISAGDVSCTIGTGGQLFAPITAPLHDPKLRMHLFCHAVPEMWHHETAILSAGLSLRWLRDGFWPEKTYQAMADGAALAQAGLEGLFFFPFLLGERTPYMSPLLPAGFLGMTIRHNQSHLVRAVMEGVVFELRQGLELMKHLGSPVRRIIASGGGTSHPLWLQLQADIFGQTVYLADSQEATARGAAILAGVGVGAYRSVEDAMFQTDQEFKLGAAPDPERTARYDSAYQNYKGLADMLADKYIPNRGSSSDNTVK